MIAIIAILAGMLLPALQQARERGRAITCVNNTKTIGSGFMFYTDEYNGVVPPTSMTGGYSWSRARRQTQLIAKYILMETTEDVALGGWGNGSGRLYKHKLACPSRTPNATITTSGNMIHGYGINNALRWVPYDWGWRPKPMFKIKNPSRGCLIAEKYLTETNGSATGNGNIINYSHNVQTGSVPGYALSYHHSGKTSVLFCDFHVDQLSSSRIPDQAIHGSGPLEAAYTTFWGVFRDNPCNEW